MRFLPAQHLRKASEFRRVREAGVCVDCGPFIAYYRVETEARERLGKPPRPGVVVSRRVGNAVVRNRVKRRFREVFRHRQEELPRDCSIVLIARRSCVRRDSGEIDARFLKLCRNVSAADHALAP